MGGGASDGHACNDHFREWLRAGMSGCVFVAALAANASAKRVAYYARMGQLRTADLAEIDATIDGYAREKRFVTLLFPHLRTPEELTELLRTIDSGERWTCTHVPWRKHERQDSALVGIKWLTEAGHATSVMGFAPMGTMPVTRRAPYFGLALWPGGFDNPYRPGTAGPEAGLVDGAHDMDKQRHDATWTQTKTKVRGLLEDPPEDNVHLRQVAFCLPRAAARMLTFKDGSGPAAVDG